MSDYQHQQFIDLSCRDIDSREAGSDNATDDVSAAYGSDSSTTPSAHPVGKVVCVGRNYAAHAAELNNPLPTKPIIFMKPATSLASLEEPIQLPVGQGECHFETEIALLIGKKIKHSRLLSGEPVDTLNPLNYLSGIGLALDLTLRELQSELKGKGHPWELAKAFDGSCPISPFIPTETITALLACENALNPTDEAAFSACSKSVLSELGLTMSIAGEQRQKGCVTEMIFPIPHLIAFISRTITLNPGDVILTGTPSGVGPLQPGQSLELSLLLNDQKILRQNSLVGQTKSES